MSKKNKLFKQQAKKDAEHSAQLQFRLHRRLRLGRKPEERLLDLRAPEKSRPARPHLRLAHRPLELEEMTDETFSQQMSRLSGVPVLKDLEESSHGKCWHTEDPENSGQLVKHTEGFENPPTEYAKPKTLADALKQEAVTGLYWHYGQCCIVLVTLTGRRIGLPRMSFYGIATVEQTPTGQRLKLPDIVGQVAKLIQKRRPN